MTARVGDCIIVGKSDGQFGVCKILSTGERDCRSDVATFDMASDIAHSWRDDGCRVWVCDEASQDVLTQY